MRATLILAAVLIGGIVVPSMMAGEETDNSIPKEFEAALEHADEFYLASITRPNSIDGFDTPTLSEWEVLGELKLRGKDRERVVNAFREAVENGDPNLAAGCFKPRHRLRLVHNGVTFEALICFECVAASLYKEGQSLGSLSIGGRKHAKPFNEVLRAAKIKIAP